VVDNQLLTAKAWFQYQGSLRGICDEQSGTSTRLLQTCQFSAANCHYTSAPVHVRSSIIHATSSSVLISIIADTPHMKLSRFVEIPNTINSYYTILSKTLKTKIRKNHLSLVLWVLFLTLVLTYPTSKSIVNTNSNIGPCDGGFISLFVTAPITDHLGSNVEILSAAHSAVPEPASCSYRHIKVG